MERIEKYKTLNELLRSHGISDTSWKNTSKHSKLSYIIEFIYSNRYEISNECKNIDEIFSCCRKIQDEIENGLTRKIHIINQIKSDLESINAKFMKSWMYLEKTVDEKKKEIVRCWAFNILNADNEKKRRNYKIINIEGNEYFIRFENKKSADKKWDSIEIETDQIDEKMHPIIKDLNNTIELGDEYVYFPINNRNNFKR